MHAEILRTCFWPFLSGFSGLFRKQTDKRFYFVAYPDEKNIFFRVVKNFPQEIENTREIIENMSEIIQNISDIFFATYTPADFQVLGR